MTNILEAKVNGQKLYLSFDGLATDRIEFAATFRDGTDATMAAIRQNSDIGWSSFGIRWNPVQVLFSEQQSRLNTWAELERPKCKSHR